MARFGVRLENDPNLSPQDYQELASQAEKNGFEAVWVPEGGGRDSLTSLATIAMKTNSVKLGTGILPIFARTPTNTAMGAAGMAAVSDGRFMLGLGVGHAPTVESRDGIPFKQPMTRMRETIQIITALLSGEEVNFAGKQVRGEEFSAWVRDQIENGDGFLPAPASVEEVGRRWGITDPEDLAWVGANVTPQPAAAMASPVHIANPKAAQIPKNFVGGGESGFDTVAERARQAGWGVYPVDSGHDTMITHARELADILLKVGRE